jgi:hypothetical protein
MLCLAMVVDYYSSVLAYDNTPLSFAKLRFPTVSLEFYSTLFPLQSMKKNELHWWRNDMEG